MDGWSIWGAGGSRKDTGKDRCMDGSTGCPQPHQSPPNIPQGLSAMAGGHHGGYRDLGNSWDCGHGRDTSDSDTVRPQEFGEEVHRDPWGARGRACPVWVSVVTTAHPKTKHRYHSRPDTPQQCKHPNIHPHHGTPRNGGPPETMETVRHKEIPPNPKIRDTQR